MTKVDDLIGVAGSEIGKPYVYGDAGPSSFDCSGLITYAFAQVGINLPHNAADQQRATTRVTSPLPGDLVFFGDPAYHVGLYIGGGHMISAPAPGQRVHVVAVGTPTNYGRVSGLGTALAPVLSNVAAGTSTAVGTATGWLGSARYVVVEALFVGLGLALVGFGLWRAEAPVRRNITETVEGIL